MKRTPLSSMISFPRDFHVSSAFVGSLVAVCGFAVAYS